RPLVDALADPLPGPPHRRPGGPDGRPPAVAYRERPAVQSPVVDLLFRSPGRDVRRRLPAAKMDILGLIGQILGRAAVSDLQGRRVLVTGGLGFIGLNLVPALLEAGAEIRILNRSAEPLALAWLERLAAGRTVEWIQGDIAQRDLLAGWLSGIDV